MASRWTSAAAIVAVLAAYVWFGSGGTWSFRRVQWQRAEGMGFTERYYAGLTEGFLRGQLALPYDVDPRWQQVTNAYDFDARGRQGLSWEMWDASLYRGKFYLYFSPVPVLLFYLPFRLLAGAYPPDSLAATLFASWVFLVCVAFARRALRETRVPFAVWVLLIGLGNVVPLVLQSVRAYEVAVAAGTAMTASFAYALLRWTETSAPRYAVWMGLWLGLAIATRPNLILLLLVALYVVWKRWRAAVLALIPLAAIGIAVGVYNYARFDNPLELGMTYQISYAPMWRVPPCSLCSAPEAIRFVNNVVHYVFWAPSFVSEFPYVQLQPHALDPSVSFAGGAEAVGGVVALNPLTLLGTAIALVLALRREGAPNAATRVMAGAWIVLFGLATCRWVTARYALDFMMLMTVATAVCVEQGMALLVDVRMRMLAVFVSVLAAYSMVVGVLLGLRGAGVIAG